MADQAACEGCGKPPEVYGSSWCSRCAAIIPDYAMDRMCKLRNALISISVNSKGLVRRCATQALEHSQSDASGDAGHG